MRFISASVIVLSAALMWVGRPTFAAVAGSPTTTTVGSQPADVFEPLRAWWYRGGKRPNRDTDTVRQMEDRFAEQPDDPEALWWIAVAQSQYLVQTGRPYTELVSKAADGGQTTAMAWLGRMYLMGDGVPFDRDRGMKLLEAALDRGESEAALNLGAAYARGIGGLTADLDRAEKYLRQALDQGNIGAHFQLADLYQRRGDPSSALQHLRTGAESGDRAAMEALAEAYRDGKLGAKVDPMQAVMWMTRAAERGSPTMQRELAKAIIGGYAGAKRNPKTLGTARLLLERAAQAKDTEAMRMLAQAYIYGQLGLAVDAPKGVELLTEAAAKDDAAALYDLGQLYIEGVAVPRDLPRAKDLLRRSAGMGFEPAVRLLKRMDASTTQPGAEHL